MISKSNHVKFALFVLLTVSELKNQKHYHFFFRPMSNKAIIRFDFGDIQNNQVSKGYQPQPSGSAFRPLSRP